VWNELRRRRACPDTLLARLPYVAWVDRVNYVAWLVCYVPVALAFLATSRAAGSATWSPAADLAARGVCFALTGRARPIPPTGRGIAGMDFWRAFSTAHAVGVFADGRARNLTQDLFFSGHTRPVPLVLYCGGGRRWALARPRARGDGGLGAAGEAALLHRRGGRLGR
jgi:hypothetical protein